MNQMEEVLYLDNAATKAPIVAEIQGNPSSLHSVGQKAKRKMESARKEIAKSINCDPKEIIFTSGGTESNNLALKGFSFANQCIIVTSGIEHKSILNSCDFLDRYDFAEHHLVDVEEGTGRVNLQNLKEVLTNCSKDKDKDILVSIQYANNEIGTIQPIKEIAEIVHSFGGILHVDAVQAYGVVKIDVKKDGIDMMSVSGHKVDCLVRGVGFLYKRNGITIEPLIHGGGQENGLRSGTENVPHIVRFGFVAKNFGENRWEKSAKFKDITDYVIGLIKETIPDVIINGDTNNRLPTNISASFKDIDGETLMMLLDTEDHIIVSTGSACNSGLSTPSYVLKKIKVPADYIRGTIRMTFNIPYHLDENELKIAYKTLVYKLKNRIESLRYIKSA